MWNKKWVVQSLVNKKFTLWIAQTVGYFFQDENRNKLFRNVGNSANQRRIKSHTAQTPWAAE
jgi:O-methyltransferase involved in polyketide biosynthesis